MAARPDAKVIFLKQTRAGAPEFNRYAVRLNAQGCVISPGDKLVIYQVDATIPDGPVLVTESTEFVFAS